MIEGWHYEDYLILCENQVEADQLADRYALSTFLPGYVLVGLKGWDDFIVSDSSGKTHTVPTVPLAATDLRPFSFGTSDFTLRADERLAGKIKWHVHPIVFGGDPSAEQNIAWVTLDQHIDLVRWWNAKYSELSPSTR